MPASYPVNTSDFEAQIQNCAKWLNMSDSVLIGAGAGLSAAAGLDYTDKTAFARDFPALVNKGFKNKASLIGFMDWSQEELWGYWAQHIYDFRFKWPPHPVYQKLLEIVKTKDYFVLTSNVDAMFVKCGFSPDRIYTPQGDYALFQCMKPCTDQTWLMEPLIEAIVSAIDKEKQILTDPALVPVCPNCGGPVFPNVRMGHWFVEKPYEKQRRSFQFWLNRQRNNRLIGVEIGSGYNTPSVVRWTMEAIVNAYAGSQFIRVNPEYPQFPKQIADRVLAFQCKAMPFVTALTDAMAS